MVNETLDGVWVLVRGERGDGGVPVAVFAERPTVTLAGYDLEELSPKKKSVGV